MQMSTDVAYALYNPLHMYIVGIGLSIHKPVVFVGVECGCYYENGLLCRVVVFNELICS